MNLLGLYLWKIIIFFNTFSLETNLYNLVKLCHIDCMVVIVTVVIAIVAVPIVHEQKVFAVAIRIYSV